MTEPIRHATKTRRVAMLIYPGVAPLDVAGPLQVFGVANFLSKQKLYDVITVAPSAEPVQTPLGFAFMPSCSMTELPLPVDTLLVSGGGSPDSGTMPAVLEWLRQAAEKARRFGSICTGAFSLGAAGLLDGKRVTTHWAFCAELARRHPMAVVEIDPIFIRDGNLYSSAGISAGIDLALALVKEDHGRHFTLSIARYLVLFLKRPGGQAQFSAQLRAQFSTVPAIQRAQEYCQANLGGDLRVSNLCQIAKMSERSFVRKFKKETGQAPAHYVMAARVETARLLLVETMLPMKVVAQRSGFGSVTMMRRAFRLRLGIMPRQYRDNFSAPRANSAETSSSGEAGKRNADGPGAAIPLPVLPFQRGRVHQSR